MTIWQRIRDAAATLADRPLSALFGGSEPRDPTRQVAFTIGVIALSAKMAKADGVVTADEVDAFHEVFQVPPDEAQHVRSVFDHARQDVAGYEAYARQLARMFRDDPRALEDLLHGLFHIATADSVFHPDEEAFLKSVAEIFGIDEAGFARVRAHHLGPDERDPYTILGIEPDAGDAAVRQAYRALVREHHPDRLIAAGVPEEFVARANSRIAAVNDAYERIRRQRNG